jgi:hypothetical protein
MLVEKILDQDRFRIFFVTAGGGHTAPAAIMSTAGASKVVEGAVSPYSRQAMAKWYGRKMPDSVLTADFSRKLASHTWKKHISDQKVMVVACTAALKTNRIRRGADIAHISFYSRENWHRRGKGHTISVELESLASREDQELFLSLTILDGIMGVMNKWSVES